MTPAEVNELLRSRRSVFPKTYIDRPIEKAIIEEILENANWAPTHKLTEPWRFKVFRGKGLQRLSDYLAAWYKENIAPEQYSEMKYQKTKSKPLRSACVIAICMQRDPTGTLPEWEEIAAVSCAVQNMYLSCAGHGIGCYWSSPRAILEARDFLRLAEGERCLGLFYMGYHDLPKLPGKRGAIEDKTVWIEE